LLCGVPLWLATLIGVAGQQQPASALQLRAYQDAILTPSTAATLAERVGQVDAILLVRAEGVPAVRVVPVDPAKVRFPTPYAEAPQVCTQYAVRVLDVLKEHPAAGVVGTNATLLQLGGDADWQGISIHGGKPHPDLIAASDYLVFLTYDRDLDALMLSPYDTYELDSGTVRAIRSGELRYGHEIVGHSVQEAIAAIVDAVQRRR
jgi:hypothetical protein